MALPVRPFPRPGRAAPNQGRSSDVHTVGLRPDRDQPPLVCDHRGGFRVRPLQMRSYPMDENSTTEQVDYDADEDLYPPDQASDLGASYFYTEAGS